MNHLKQTKIKTLTIYSGQQIAFYFQQFKQKINQAYDKEDVVSIKQLLYLIKLTIVLFDVPAFAQQLNRVGDIQITSYLQALYVKNTMWKNQLQQEVKNCILQLINMFEKQTQSYKMTTKLKDLKYKKVQSHFSTIFAQMLQFMHRLREIVSMSVYIEFLKVIIISLIQSKRLVFEFYEDKEAKKLSNDWITIVKMLIKYCRIIQNLKKEQTAISICYWLCSTQKLFIPQCVNQGILNILQRTLANKKITESYGTKIINFLKLLINETDSIQNFFSSSDFQNSIVKFGQKFNNQKMLKQLRQLMNVNEKKNNLNHKEKLELFKILSQDPKQNEKQLVENIHLIGLYARSDRISDFIFNIELRTFEDLITVSSNIQIFKQIFSAMTYVFQIQKGTIKPIELSLSKLKSILSSKNDSFLKILTNDKKKLLINLLRMLKELLSNKKYLTQVIESIKENNLEKLFSNFSDCTNFVYENEFLSFRLMMKSITKEQTQQDKQNETILINALQKHLIEKSITQIKKLPGEDQLSEIKLLYGLLKQNPNSSELTLNKELVQAISKKTYETIDLSSLQKGLDIFASGQNSKINEIKTQINKFSLMFFNELFKIKGLAECLSNQQILVKNVKIGLNTDKQQILEEVIQYVIQHYRNFGLPQTYKQLIYELWRKGMQKSKRSQQEPFLQVLRYLTKSNKLTLSPDKKIKNFMQSLTQKQSILSDEESQIHVILKGMELSAVQQFLKKLSQLEPSPQNLLSYLNCIYELSKQQNLKQLMFKLFSNKLKTFYAQQVQSPKNSNSQSTKDKIYLILSELIECNIKSNSQYFNEFLKISLIKQYNPIITKESALWVQQALKCKQITSYETKTQRCSDLFDFVQNTPEVIGIECATLLQFQDKREQEFIQKQKTSMQLQVLKSIETHNLNFFERYSPFCSNQVFSACGLVILFDKILQQSVEQFQKFSESVFREENIKSLVQGSKTNLLLNLVQKRSNIISSFICSQRIILNENEYKHTVRNISQILELSIKTTNQLTKQNISQKNKLCLINIISQMLTTLIHIFRNGLQSTELTQNQQKFMSRMIKQFVCFQNKEVNSILSQLLRLMILKDKERKFYSIQKDDTYNAVSTQLNKLNTERGFDHLAVCKAVLGWGPTANKKQMTKMVAQYFLLEIQDQPTTISQTPPVNPDSMSITNRSSTSNRQSRLSLSSSISDVELIKHLKNLLHPPYTYGLNIVSKFLKPIRSKEYVQTLMDVFILSSSLYEQDFSNQYCPLPQLRQNMIDTILQEFCDISQRFYITLGIGRQGASLALKRKGIGIRGVQIICDKMLQYKDSDDVPLYAQILTLNALSLEQLSIIDQKKIPSLLNQLYKKKSIRAEYCIKLGNLIGQSSKLQQIQEQYSVNKQLVENLVSFNFKKNNLCVSATLSAIAGVTYCNSANQKDIGTIDTVKQILILSTNEQANQLIVEKGFNALANIVFKNKAILRTYFDLQVERKTLKVLQSYTAKQINNPLCIKQMLRLLGILALTSQGGFKLINLRYLDVARQLTLFYIQQREYQIVKLAIDVLFNITNQTQNDNRVTIKKMHEQKATQFLISIAKQCPLNGPIISSCLQSLENLLNYDFILQQAITPALIELLQQLSQTQQTSQTIFSKWFRLLYLIFKNEYKFTEIALSNILFSASNYLRAISFINPKILEINMILILKLKDKLKPNELAQCGWIEFLIENLKSTNQPPQNLSKILDILLELTQKNLLTPFMCTKLFQILIKRLQLQYRDQNARKLILLLKKIKEKINISSQTAIFLLQFSCFFLSQKDIILSPRYHRRVRQIISILAYFISFNIELKIIFRNPNLESILKDWIKIDTLIEEQTSIGQSCRLCLFAIYNEQNPLTSIKSVEILRESLARDELQKGCKCTLYRRDGSNKSGMVKLNKERNEIVAFKHPKGQVKPKYVIPLDSILCFRSEYEQEDDMLYDNSVFPKDSGIFSKKPKSELLLTIMGMVGQQLSIRSINVQFNKVQAKSTFVEHLKLVVTAYMNKRIKS